MRMSAHGGCGRGTGIDIATRDVANEQDFLMRGRINARARRVNLSFGLACWPAVHTR